MNLNVFTNKDLLGSQEGSLDEFLINSPNFTQEGRELVMKAISEWIDNLIDPTEKLVLKLDRKGARHLLNVFNRTFAKGEDLDYIEVLDEKLINYINKVDGKTKNKS